MSAGEDFSFSLAEFSGTTRLFPLPNLVLFPHVMQPLHVFEPRYRELLEETLAGDRLITMATLKPGWEADYEGRPPLEPMACLGRVAVHQRLETGGFNILLSGLRRVRLLRELAPIKRFREADVEVYEDQYPLDEASAAPELHRRLRDALFAILPDLPQAHEHIEHLLSTDLPLGTLTDVIGYMLDIATEEKEALLAEVNVYRRAELLLSHLALVAADFEPGRSGVLEFPPAFSSN
jgi:uncharacterized protein